MTATHELVVPKSMPMTSVAVAVDSIRLEAANGALLRSWLAPRAGNLMDRLGKLQDAGAVADELYLSVLTRPPTADEKKEVADYLKKRNNDRAAALQEYTWALLTSAEFRFNH